MGHDEKPELVIESTQRFRRVSVTVDRIEPPQPDDWTTGEHYFGAYDDTAERLLGAAGVRSDDVPVQPVVRRKVVRLSNRRERLLRFAAASGLLLFILVFFFEAFTQSVAHLISGEQPAWRAVTVQIESVPVSARVVIGEKERGRTPVSAVERCRGRIIRVRLEAPGYATWSWRGLCPQRGELNLVARLQPLP